MQTYLSKHWHKLFDETWGVMFNSEKYTSIQEYDLPEDLFILLASPVYTNEITELTKHIESLEEKINLLYATDKGSVVNKNRKELKRLEPLYALMSGILKEKNDLRVLDDPDAAFDYLNKWHKQNRINEEYAVSLIYKWHETLKEVCSSNQMVITEYIKLVREFLDSRNLRYLLLENSGDIKLVFNPAVLFMEKIITLKEECLADGNLCGMYNDFEEEIRELISGCSSRKAKTVLQSAFSLLEGSLKKATSHNGTRSIGHIANNELPLDYFPNEEAKQVLIKLNNFFNSYPGLRHSSPAVSANRDLDEKDAIVFSGISALLSKYLLEK